MKKFISPKCDVVYLTPKDSILVISDLSMSSIAALDDYNIVDDSANWE